MRLSDGVVPKNSFPGLVLERIADCVILSDRSGAIVFANSAAYSLFGMATDAASGPESVDRGGLFFPAGGLPLSPEMLPLSRALRGETVFADCLVVRNTLNPQGRLVTANAFPSLDSDGRVDGAVVIYRDAGSLSGSGVSPSEEDFKRLVAVFNHGLDAVLLADDEMRYVDANPSASVLLGYSRDELLSLRIPNIVPPERRASTEAQWNAFLSVGVAEGCMDLVRKDGAIVTAEFRAVAQILPSIHLSVLRDVTERKRAEALLREAQKTESVGVLAGAAAHDFNNLLVGIIGNASLALERYSGDRQLASLLQDILAAGERAGLLSRQLLNYAGKAPAYREKLNLSKLVEEIGTLVQASIPKQVRLQFELANVLAIEADPSHIQQVVMNLIINAGQAIFEQSSGEIRIRTGAAAMPDANAAESASLPPGDYVFLEVEDTGRGMDGETMERIFEPFFTTKASGRGLGLATIRAIARDHGGCVWVRSSPGRGSCFTVLFPTAQEDGGEEFIEGPDDRHPKTGNILVLDDEPIVQRLAKSALEFQGHRVTVLTDARDAGSLLTSPDGAFDLVLLDLGLPGASVIDLSNQIRALRPETKIVVFSAQPEEEARRLLDGLDFVGYLRKPCTAAQLSQAVRRALS